MAVTATAVTVTAVTATSLPHLRAHLSPLLLLLWLVLLQEVKGVLVRGEAALVLSLFW
jgi:uncharacterized protein (DUF983 family)